MINLSVMPLLAELQYPIGHFNWSGVNTPTDHERMISVLEQIPGRYTDAVSGLSAVQLDTPYREGGWTLRQVIHHVPDSHMMAYSRMKMALTEDTPVIKPYSQNLWAELADRTAPVEVSLAMLKALHMRWALLFRALAPEDWAISFRHPESGMISFDKLLAMYTWHSEHHLAHITMTRQRHGW